MNKCERLESIYSELRSSGTLCGLSDNSVLEEGDPDSPVMFIGEAPRRSEDRLGRPFVGVVGKVLDSALEEAGWESRLGVHRLSGEVQTSGKQAVRREEVAFFFSFLRIEIEVIRPRIICLLGAIPVQELPGRALRDVCSRSLDLGRPTYFSTCHPAATIYDLRLRQMFIGYIMLLAGVVASLQT